MLLRPSGIMAEPIAPAVAGGTGAFNVGTGTASITDGTSNTIVMPRRITSDIIAVLIG